MAHDAAVAETHRRDRKCSGLHEVACCDIISVEMETLDFHVDSSACNLSKISKLRGLIWEKMTTSVREMLAVVETTVAGYEDEVSCLKRELDHHKRQLHAVLQPQVSLCRIVLEGAAGSQNNLSPVSTNGGEHEHAVESTRPEHKDTGNKKHPTSEKSTGKNVPSNVKVSHQWIEALEHGKDSDCTLEDLPSNLSVSCPTNAEGGQSDGDINETQNKEGKIKRRKRLPKRYISYHTEPDSDDGAENVIEDNMDNEWKPDKNKNLQSSNVKKKHLLKLRIGLLMNCPDSELSKAAFRLERPVQMIMCQQNLSESDFLNQLRSTFPELRENKLFDAFLTDSSKRLPLLVNRMTPQQLYRAYRSSGKRRGFAFYIQQKEHEDTLTTSNGDNKPSVSSCSSLVVKQQSETVGICETTDEPEQNDEAGEHSDASKSERSIRDCDFKKKNGSLQLFSADNGDSCKVCGSLFRSKSILMRHALSHADNSKGHCGVCGHQFELSKELRCHLKTHQKRHRCDTCGRCFLSSNSFRKDNATDATETLKCQICRKAFARKKWLKRHESVKNEEKTYKCDTRPLSFRYKQQLDVHNTTHTGEKKYCCDICGKFLSNFISVSHHKLIHTGQKNYSCKDCGKRFNSSWRQKQHEKIHTTRERNDLCDICSKAFYTPGELRAHQRIHNEKQVKCTVCNKLLRGNLERHMMTHTGEKPFSCSECGKKFPSRSNLKKHIKTHQGIKPFTCKVCGKSCGRLEYLKVHMRTHTGEKPYQCTLCERAFTQSHSLKTHMKRHNGERTLAAEGLS